MAFLLALSLTSCRTKWFIGDDSDEKKETEKTEENKSSEGEEQKLVFVPEVNFFSVQPTSISA